MVELDIWSQVFCKYSYVAGIECAEQGFVHLFYLFS